MWSYCLDLLTSPSHARRESSSFPSPQSCYLPVLPHGGFRHEHAQHVQLQCTSNHHSKKQRILTTIRKSVNNSLALNFDLAHSTAAYLKPRGSEQVKSDENRDQAYCSPQRTPILLTSTGSGPRPADTDFTPLRGLPPLPPRAWTGPRLWLRAVSGLPRVGETLSRQIPAGHGGPPDAHQASCAHQHLGASQWTLSHRHFDITTSLSPQLITPSFSRSWAVFSGPGPQA